MRTLALLVFCAACGTDVGAPEEIVDALNARDGGALFDRLRLGDQHEFRTGLEFLDGKAGVNARDERGSFQALLDAARKRAGWREIELVESDLGAQQRWAFIKLLILTGVLGSFLATAWRLEKKGKKVPKNVWFVIGGLGLVVALVPFQAARTDDSARFLGNTFTVEITMADTSKRKAMLFLSWEEETSQWTLGARRPEVKDGKISTRTGFDELRQLGLELDARRIWRETLRAPK